MFSLICGYFLHLLRICIQHPISTFIQDKNSLSKGKTEKETFFNTHTHTQTHLKDKCFSKSSPYSAQTKTQDWYTKATLFPWLFPRPSHLIHVSALGEKIKYKKQATSPTRSSINVNQIVVKDDFRINLWNNQDQGEK